VVLAAMLVVGLTAGDGAAQQVAGVPLVGLLHQTSEGARAADRFRQGMRSLGWIEGTTVRIESRFANGDPAQLSANAAAFAAAKVDVIVAFSGKPALAARQATSAIPIVMDAGDPVGMGLVASLARPGGNITGQSLMRPDMAAKQLGLLKEAVPSISKIGVLMQRDYGVHTDQMAELERAAAALGISVLPIALGTGQDLPRHFDEMIAAGADAYLVLNEPRTDAMRGDIIALATRHRLPGAAQERRYAEAGALFSYGVSLDAIHRRAAVFVDKILKGAKPADLPVEQPTTFELVINLKTAKALGLTVPQSLLARADEVIE
jgi:putative tryptophan/tyrosine transport system substrate-binding protein